ncbi:putative membrane protein [Bacilli bacterium PM5-3]|nr:putative membrane protein [Bacilli bacterium PM5-3]MDH6603445.1 putative membrane protein [Bacilli bacterium PM5-9]
MFDYIEVLLLGLIVIISLICIIYLAISYFKTKKDIKVFIEGKFNILIFVFILYTILVIFNFVSFVKVYFLPFN